MKQYIVDAFTDKPFETHGNGRISISGEAVLVATSDC